ncbi:Aste57867_18549 [Aphanomyces stellatus]|uniref:Aste57867_18549 protein n=1 Tax=Aphanomyces stellatus TaxID=120398 RepID=A0A485LBV9_9STRA|nr:hypothetical protein As57867_018487 [Aphanomyces stellatus]VFT95285.1 Aste57867_18549 [Aphanomyces stellatus]
MGESNDVKHKKQAAREKLLASKRAWAKEHYENNRERILEINRNWAKKNRDKIRETKRRYRERNREKHRHQIKTYYRNWKRRREERAAQGIDESTVDDPEPPQDIGEDDDDDEDDDGRAVDDDEDDDEEGSTPTSERYTPRQRSLVLVRIQKYWQRLEDHLPERPEDMEKGEIDAAHIDDTPLEETDVSEDESMYARAHEMIVLRRRKRSRSGGATDTEAAARLFGLAHKGVDNNGDDDRNDEEDRRLERLKAVQDPSMAAVLETIFLMRGSAMWQDPSTAASDNQNL